MSSIQTNLEMRCQSLERSLSKYQRGGRDFEKIVQDYLRVHLAILSCEEEIEGLEAVKSGGSRNT
jgi:hypothetical protein